MTRVLSIGALAMDVVLNANALARDDGFAMITHEQMVPGGSASNVAVAAASLGLEVYQTGQVGDDNVGKEFRRTLAADGVDTRYLLEKAGGTTMHTYIIVTPDGRHCIFANPGDTMQETNVDDLPATLADEMDVLYTDIFCTNASLALARSFAQRGKPVIYNMQCTPAFMRQLGTTDADVDELLRLCTLFVSGREGYEELTGTTDRMQALQTLYERYPVRDGLIYTAGSDATLWYDGTQTVSALPYKVDVADTTGAGDSFIGGLLAGQYVLGADRQTTLAFANAAAAVKCTQAGPRLHASLADVQAFFGNHVMVSDER